MGSTYPLTGRCILVIEDEPLIALEIAALFQSVGATVVTGRSVTEATSLLGRFDVCAAVVDHGLGDADTSEFCRELQRRGIRFMLYTGYSDVQRHYPRAPVVQKPASGPELLGVMTRLMAAHAT